MCALLDAWFARLVWRLIGERGRAFFRELDRYMQTQSLGIALLTTEESL